MSKKAVFGIVRTQSEAVLIVSDLENAGFATSDVSVLFPGAGESRDFAIEKGTKAPEGAVAGGGTGAVAGGAFGLLAGLGALAIPGIGPLVAAGPIMAALSGMAVGAAVGSIAGGLIGLGIPEIQAKLYEGKVKSGSVLVSVHTESSAQVDAAKGIFERRGATDVSVASEASVPDRKSPYVASGRA
jgi:hypothetical protein